MTYHSNNELPKGVQNVLPDHGQDIYREAFNHAWETYKNPDKRKDPNTSREEVAHRVAWSAVEKKYEKQPNSNWKAK